MLLRLHHAMLTSLERQSGLPMAFDPAANAIHWPAGVSVGRTSARSAEEMREYIREPGAHADQVTIYTVWREVARSDDKGRIRAAHLRYDITVIPPGHFAGECGEYFRTAGHYHPLKPGTAVAYPEVFEVIAGRAYWLIQRPARPAGGPSENDPAALEEIYAVEAGPGQKAVMLPGFGHISVNAFAEPLVMANWISDTFAYDYEPFRTLRGGGYWLVAGEVPETIEFERNPNYRAVPELKKLRPAEVPELGLLRSRPLYALAQHLEHLQFLNEPEKFRDILTIEHCYRIL